ncbi:hypothetical protein ILUMI_21041 [Ignelater luminosus]|uniref:Uncharacterized protein n=1 Tax=Ignelater luminosus TaxID=2038154 RepID=A0A8K0CFC0_IGNLU|nr:hypothetical protein ILUMI_21041 [Ignelater luminosus]
MYVIFPADEVVYLSYGRLILFPNSQETGRETETSSTTPSAHKISDNRSSNPSVPSTSTSSTRSFHSVISGPSLSSYSEDLQESSRLRRGGLETLQGSVKSNSSWPQPSTSRAQAPIKPQRTKKKRLSLLAESPTNITEKPSDKPISIQKSVNQDLLQPPLQRSNSKSPNSGRKLSYSEYVTVYSGEETKATIESLPENFKSEGNPSSSVSPRVKLARSLEREKAVAVSDGEKCTPSNSKETKSVSSRTSNTKGQKSRKSTEKEISFGKSKNSPAVNREKSSKNPENSSIDRENTPVNIPRAKNECEYLSVGEETLSKPLLKGSFPYTKQKELSLNVDSRLQLTGLQQQTPEKTPPAKKSFFGSVRGKRTLETTPKMAGTESPLRDLTHPSYNEALKAHNGVTFKLVRTDTHY